MGWNDPDFWNKMSDKYGGLSGANNMTKPHGDATKAQAGVAQASDAFSGMQAPTLTPVSSRTVSTAPVAAQKAQTTMAGPSAYNGISTDPSAQQAQQSQMAALSSLAKNGGRSAASDASLAQIQQNENANARGQRGAIMQNAQARGMGGSGNSLLAQLTASQNATNNQSAQDMMVRGQDQNAALQAGMGAAQIGSNMEQQQYGEQAQKAAAADAIARFNAGNQGQTSVFNAGQANAMNEANAGRDLQGQTFNAGSDQRAQEFNSGLGQQEFADTMGIRSGQQAGGKTAADYWAKKYEEDQKTNGGIMGGGEKALAALFASRGGRVPGVPSVHGDSLRNDTVPVMTSPHEVVVPKTLAQSGSRDQIASFVKHPPPIEGSKDKEAMLGALKNMRSRR